MRTNDRDRDGCCTVALTKIFPREELFGVDLSASARRYIRC